MRPLELGCHAISIKRKDGIITVTSREVIQKHKRRTYRMNATTLWIHTKDGFTGHVDLEDALKLCARLQGLKNHEQSVDKLREIVKDFESPTPIVLLASTILEILGVLEGTPEQKQENGT